MKAPSMPPVAMRLLVLLLLSTHAGHSFALDCNKALNTLEINECASARKDKVEAKLNRTYQRVIKSLSRPDTESEGLPGIKKSLIAAQRA